MPQPLVFFNAQFVPASEAVLPIHDAGLVMGATVTDFCRTFHQRLFRWEDHLARFRRDCAACFIPLSHSDETLTDAAHHLLAHNASLYPSRSELALITFATPGPLGVYAGLSGQNGPATLVMHTFPLSFERYRPFFQAGISLAVAGHHGSNPTDLAPPLHKHRSRLHWWRADHLLRQRPDIPAGAIALLLDGPNGNVTETAIGNLLIVRGGAVLTPPRGSVLDGISLRVIEELCFEQGVPFREQSLTLAECQSADEVMLAGTAFCLAGVRWLEGKTLTWPGPLTRRLLEAWSARLALDIAGQFTSLS